MQFKTSQAQFFTTNLRSVVSYNTGAIQGYKSAVLGIMAQTFL